MRHQPATVRRTVGVVLTLGAMTLPGIASAQNPTSITLNAIDPCNKFPSGRVNLSGAAPTGGLALQLSSSAPTSATVPNGINVAAGATSADFQVTCIPSSQAVAVTITASVRGGTGQVTAVVNVLAPVLNTITVQPHTGGLSVNGQVNLVSAAPTGGVVVTLSSSSTKATVPPFVTVPSGATSAGITITTRSVAQNTSVSIIATGLGVTKTADVTLVPPRPTAMGFSSNAAPALAATKTLEGSSSKLNVRVNIGHPAPSGFAVQLSSSNTAAARVPASVVFEPGATFAEFWVDAGPVAQPATVTITATSGGGSQSCVVTIVPAELKSLGLTPSTVIGGQSAQGRVFYLSGAPAGGTRIQLTSNNPGLVHVPASITVPEGENQLAFPIETNGLEQRAVVTVTADAGGVKKTAQLELVPEGPSALRVAPADVTGGVNTKGEVDAIPSPDQFVVQLASSHPAVAAVPSSVSFTAGTTRKNFVITTSPVAQDTRVTISATTTSNAKGGKLFQSATPQKTSFTVTRTFGFDVLAPVVTAFSFDNGSVASNALTTVRVTLNGAAPVGGFPLRIGYEREGLFYPQTFTVPAGATLASFSVRAPSVQSSDDFLYVAITGSVRKTAVIRVVAP